MKKREVFGLQKLEHEKQILKEVTDKVKERCIERKVGNMLLAKKNRWYGWERGNDLMGYKVKENSGDDCPYYTMKASNFIEEVRRIQNKKSKETIKDQSIK